MGPVADHDFGCFRRMREMVLEDMVENDDNPVWPRCCIPNVGLMVNSQETETAVCAWTKRPWAIRKASMSRSMNRLHDFV